MSDKSAAPEFPRPNPVDSPTSACYDRLMGMTVASMLDRFYARDPSYNGRFLIGVLTTGVYCLPSCTARKPKPENVRFFRTPAEAREAGFRPCLRCRPDEFHERYDPARESLLVLAGKIREHPERFAAVPDMARTLGVGTTSLNALFHRYFHRCASRFLTEARIEQACRILASTRDKVTEIGLAVGYGSLSSFNENFHRLTGLSPEEYRRIPRARAFTLSLPAGTRPAAALRLQGRDRESLCERAAPSSLVKALVLEDQPVVLELTARGASVMCELQAKGAVSPAAAYEAHRMVARLLGLSPDPHPFERQAHRDPALRRMVERRPGLRIPQTATVFEGLAWAIIGQQINLPFAFQLRRHLVELAGWTAEQGLRAHPTPAQVAALEYVDLQRLKFSRRKAEYLIDAARLVVSGDLPIESFPWLTADEVQERLRNVRGIGPWSSGYLAMRARGFEDCVPIGDTGLACGLQEVFALAERPKPDAAERLMEGFRPYRSFATFHLWQAIGGGA